MAFKAANSYLSTHRRNRHLSAAMNRYERPHAQGEAVVQYLDGDYRVMKPGTFVRCAVTGVQIPLGELRYWSVQRQEAYATPEVALQVYAEKLRNGRA
jgi:hypothetical protein